MTRDREEQIIEAAYKEAKARGLPPGWTCTIDKRKRRKWTAPNNGKSCDSIPKAIAISVDLGLLPPDTVIPSGKKKKKRAMASSSSSSSNKKPSKRAKQQQLPQSASAASAEDATAEAAASLLSMVQPQQQQFSKEQVKHESDREDDGEESDEEDAGPPPIDMDPETTLEVYVPTGSISREESTLPTTVHWDPTSPDGRKIGWKVKIEHKNGSSGSVWEEGRVVRYDPHTHKHKIVFDDDEDDDDDDDSDDVSNSCWIWLRNEQHNLQLATRMVWAHVKGYAWWPALVMEANVEAAKTKEGYLLIHFFGTGEISCLRDHAESVRPFHPDHVDPVVAKHRKKRNQRAYQLACDEYRRIQQTRNRAAQYYAQCALQMACYYAPRTSSSSSTAAAVLAGANRQHALLGRRVQLFRPDVNYPYGDTVVGRVRQYSPLQKKWLVSFEISELQSQKTKYPPAWLNLYAKEHTLKVLDKQQPVQPSGSSSNATTSSTIKNEDLLPFLFGYEPVAESSDDADAIEIAELLKTRCRGCVEYLKVSGGSPDSNSSKRADPTVTCETCQGTFHLPCCDPPLSVEMWQRQLKDGTAFVCSRCTPCRGCYGKDIAFGSHAHPSPPPTLSLPPGCDSNKLHLCSTCRVHYDAERFCPNCAHSWDDKKFDMVRRQIEYGVGGGSTKGRKRGKGSGGRILFEDSASQLLFGSFDHDEDLPVEVPVDPCLFYPETSEWGYTEDEMLVCDNCDVWVHAGCSGMTEDEYEVTSNGDHPIYSKEYLCRVCCRKRCKEIIAELQKEDHTMLFALPVSEKIVPNYHDIIKEPMDLHTMLEKAESEEFLNYAWVREMFELMVLNALTFNRYYTDVYREAKRFYHTALQGVFASIGSAAPPGKYEKAILKCFDRADEARKNEEERVQVDESVEKKDLVAGTVAATVNLPKLLASPPDQPSCVPFTEAKMKALDAFYCSWMDCCFTCGSSGASDTFLFCVDCGEAFHSFCVSAPVHSMELSSVAGWRCPNCKICEISGDVPPDETRMLFCEMCDRGFSLDLLDPPLTSAPSGLWICGQCVDCKMCGNKAEKDGASLRFWSQDPEKCFRCGGCGDLVNDSLGGKCHVCSGLLREDDQDVVECNNCHSKVHVSCDERAQDYLCLEAAATRIQKAQNTTGNTYVCPTCFEPSAGAVKTSSIDQDRSNMSAQGMELIREAKLGPHDNVSDAEIHQWLVEEIDWATRDQWRDEYLSIIRDALRIYCMAKTLGDPRFVIQQVLRRMHQLPGWLGHRALRFAVLVKRKEWDTKGFSHERIEVVVLTAKLAAAFIDIVCRTLGINKEKDVSFYARLEDLVRPPSVAGEYSCPFDSIRRSKDAIAIDDSGFVFDIDNNAALSTNKLSESKHTASTKPAAKSTYKIASPLCGWGSEVRNPSGLTEWRDPRECCLCHICGDDDAGFSEPTDNEPKRSLVALGRLLPMSDGNWVHTSCALWSSEVWEAPDDGLVHAMEKARGRGAQLKCFGCGRSGATVGCNKSNCPFNYHFPCAKASGCVFSSSQQVFCATHKSAATSTLAKESIEHMKALLIAPEKKDPSEITEADLCSRVGSLVVHSLGSIESEVDGFHSENYITPPGYVSSRIFWSARRPRSRTVYILKVERGVNGQAEFSILPGDDPTARLTGNTASQVYATLMERVRKVNSNHFSQGMFSKLPVVRRTRKKTFGLNGPQFFGFGLDHVRRLLESSPGVEAVAAALTTSSPQYRFCFAYGPDASNPSALIELIKGLQRKRAAKKAEQASQNSSGCARTEGIKAVVTSGGSGRITRALVRSAEDDAADASGGTKKNEDKAVADRNIVQVKYRQMKAIPIDQRLVARRSHIHGWGLFAKRDIPKYYPVVEYMGEVIRKNVADKREKAYELSGEGSCYMFRLDLKRIVDATKIGCMARFMNHSCQPNAYAKIVSVDTDQGQDRKIVVFANRDIATNEEITYDYKFPVEDGSLRCTCGAPNCIGRLN